MAKSSSNTKAHKEKLTYEAVREEFVELGFTEGKDFFPFNYIDDPHVLMTLDMAMTISHFND